MTQWTLGSLRCAFAHLDQARVNGLAWNVLRLDRDESKPLSETAVLQFLVADWLSCLSDQMGFINDAQIQWILKAISPALEEIAEPVVRFEVPGPPITLMIADYRYVACSGEAVFHDFINMTRLVQLPVPAVTHLMCDLRALYFRFQDHQEAVRTQEGSQDGRLHRQSRRAAGSAPCAPDVR